MRAFVTTLLVLGFMAALAPGANGDQSQRLTIVNVRLDGTRHVLSRHYAVPELFALSPDRKQLAYAPYIVDGTKSTDLWVAQADSSRDVFLVRTPGWILDIAWAPDARKIALWVGSQFPDPDVSGVYLVDPDGSHLHRIADSGSELAWSPDSKSLAMGRSDRRGRNWISVLSLTTGEERVLADGFGPKWSPDGTSVLYEDNATHRTEGLTIRVIPAVGGQSRTVAYGLKPLWAPNGRNIAFSRVNPDNSTSLWVVSSRRGRPRLLARRAYSEDAVWSATSDTIAFTRVLHLPACNPYRCNGLYSVSAKGGHPKLLEVQFRRITPIASDVDGRGFLYLGRIFPG